ncbi:MAG: 30S ribosomal protein S9 [Bdellovibrionales bacterium]|nr:30S ribosomal protein S9 [Bdellovibrionales bacterium]
MAAKENITYATGRRKSSSARVYLSPAEEGSDTTFVVNKRVFEEYFPNKMTQKVICQPLDVAERLKTYNIKATVRGGGPSGQAGAIRLGISRALIDAEPELRGVLKKSGFLTRDPRKVERKKPGHHKARKKPQFSKR